MDDKIKFVCQSCGKVMWLQPQVYIAYAGKTECMDCRTAKELNAWKNREGAK